MSPALSARLAVEAGRVVRSRHRVSRRYDGTGDGSDIRRRAQPEVTPGVLRELRKNGERATFFVLGAHAASHPDLITAIREDGHELANHLYTDRWSARLSDREFVEELLRTDSSIQPASPIKWCRPGGGVITRRLIRLMNEHRYTA